MELKTRIKSVIAMVLCVCMILPIVSSTRPARALEPEVEERITELEQENTALFNEYKNELYMRTYNPNKLSAFEETYSSLDLSYDLNTMADDMIALEEVGSFIFDAGLSFTSQYRYSSDISSFKNRLFYEGIRYINGYDIAEYSADNTVATDKKRLEVYTKFINPYLNNTTLSNNNKESLSTLIQNRYYRMNNLIAGVNTLPIEYINITNETADSTIIKNQVYAAFLLYYANNYALYQPDVFRWLWQNNKITEDVYNENIQSDINNETFNRLFDEYDFPVIETVGDLKNNAFLCNLLNDMGYNLESFSEDLKTRMWQTDQYYKDQSGQYSIIPFSVYQLYYALGSDLQYVQKTEATNIVELSKTISTDSTFIDRKRDFVRYVPDSQNRLVPANTERQQITDNLTVIDIGYNNPFYMVPSDSSSERYNFYNSFVYDTYDNQDVWMYPQANANYNQATKISTYGNTYLCMNIPEGAEELTFYVLSKYNKSNFSCTFLFLDENDVVVGQKNINEESFEDLGDYRKYKYVVNITENTSSTPAKMFLSNSNSPYCIGVCDDFSGGKISDYIIEPLRDGIYLYSATQTEKGKHTRIKFEGNTIELKAQFNRKNGNTIQYVDDKYAIDFSDGDNIALKDYTTPEGVISVSNGTHYVDIWAMPEAGSRNGGVWIGDSNNYEIINEPIETLISKSPYVVSGKTYYTYQDVPNYIWNKVRSYSHSNDTNLSQYNTNLFTELTEVTSLITPYIQEHQMVYSSLKQKDGKYFLPNLEQYNRSTTALNMINHSNEVLQNETIESKLNNEYCNTFQIPNEPQSYTIKYYNMPKGTFYITYGGQEILKTVNILNDLSSGQFNVAIDPTSKSNEIVTKFIPLTKSQIICSDSDPYFLLPDSWENKAVLSISLQEMYRNHGQYGYMFSYIPEGLESVLDEAYIDILLPDYYNFHLFKIISNNMEESEEKNNIENILKKVDANNNIAFDSYKIGRPYNQYMKDLDERFLEPININLLNDLMYYYYPAMQYIEWQYDNGKISDSDYRHSMQPFEKLFDTDDLDRNSYWKHNPDYNLQNLNNNPTLNQAKSAYMEVMDYLPSEFTERCINNFDEIAIDVANIIAHEADTPYKTFTQKLSYALCYTQITNIHTAFWVAKHDISNQITQNAITTAKSNLSLANQENLEQFEENQAEIERLKNSSIAETQTVNLSYSYFGTDNTATGTNGSYQNHEVEEGYALTAADLPLDKWTTPGHTTIEIKGWYYDDVTGLTSSTVGTTHQKANIGDEITEDTVLYPLLEINENTESWYQIIVPLNVTADDPTGGDVTISGIVLEDTTIKPLNEDNKVLMTSTAYPGKQFIATISDNLNQVFTLTLPAADLSQGIEASTATKKIKTKFNGPKPLIASSWQGTIEYQLVTD